MADSLQPPEVIAARICRELGLDPRIVRAREGREYHLFRVLTPAGLCGPDDPGGERLLKFPRVDALPDPFDLARPATDRLRAEGIVLTTLRGVSVSYPYRIFRTNPVCAVMGVLPGTTAEIAHERGQLDETGQVGVCLQMGSPTSPTSSCAALACSICHLGNVLGRPQLRSGWTITGVVDWTCARWGPVEADLVEMQACVFILNPRARDAFVAG